MPRGVLGELGFLRLVRFFAARFGAGLPGFFLFGFRPFFFVTIASFFLAFVVFFAGAGLATVAMIAPRLVDDPALCDMVDTACDEEARGVPGEHRPGPLERMPVVGEHAIGALLRAVGDRDDRRDSFGA